MKKKEVDEKSFLKMALIMAGVVMIFSSANSIFLAYSVPKVPQREVLLKLTQSEKGKESKKDATLSAAESVVCEQNLKTMLPNMQSIYEKNNDVVGWIKIEGTVIDYPVMYTPDDGEFYLYKDFYKNKDINGSIFIDKHCHLEPRDTNLIFHGHNMNNGSMFGALIKYKSKDFYDSHKQILFDTLYENQIYEIVSVFISKVYNVSDNIFKYYRFYNAKNQEEFNYFYENIKNLSLYEINTQAEFGDEFITLSTCENSVKNGRFVVVAKKLKTNMR